MALRNRDRRRRILEKLLDEDAKQDLSDLHGKQKPPTGPEGVDGVELKEVPLIHIVGDVRKTQPAQLYVTGEEQPSFEMRFHNELFDMVKKLMKSDERKIQIHYDTNSPHREFIYWTAERMGFFYPESATVKENYPDSEVLFLNTRKFMEFSRNR